MRKLKMNKIKIVVSIAFLLGCVLVNASDIYTPVFYGNVTVSNWPGITNTAITTTSGGTMTNGVYTNTYRLYMTNIFGRTTRSTNLTSTFTGDVTYTNAVQLTWGRYYKYATHVIIEKSWDAGVNWTNWIAIAGTNVSYIDYGTNTWTASTNTTAAIPSGVYPWSGTADVATVAANLNTASNALHLAITSEVGRATAAEDANTASIGSNDTDIAVNAGDISTNAIDISTNAIDIATETNRAYTVETNLQAQITDNAGYTNYAYLSWLWGDWATNYYDWDRVTNTPTTVGAGGYGVTDVYTKVESDATFATTGTVGDVVADWSGSPATQTVEYISQYSTNSVFNAVDYAQNATNDTTFPDPQSEQWQSPEFATSNDDNGAGVINAPADESSSTLVLTNFGFSIPSDAVIRGVQSTTIHKQTNTTGNLSNDYYQYLYVGGVFVTNDASYTFSYSTNNYLWITNTLGDTTNHWNTNLTPAIVNSSGFGIGTYFVPATATTIAAIDVVYLTVYYYRTPVTNWSAGATTNGEFDFNYEGANQFRVTSTGFNGTWGGYSQTDFSGTGVLADVYTKVESDATFATTGTVGDISTDVDTLKGLTNATVYTNTLGYTNAVELAGSAVQRTGDTNEIDLTSTAHVHVSDPTDGEDVANAAWTRSLLSGGQYLYASTNVNPHNASNYTFRVTLDTNNSTRTYSDPAADEYVGTVMTTQRYFTVYSPMSVNAYLGGESGGSISICPEFYYSYDGTNYLGDWDAAAQTVVAGSSNLYQWIISFPTITATNDTGFFVVRRFKIAANSPAKDLYVYVGGSTPSHIAFGVPPATDAGKVALVDYIVFTNAQHSIDTNQNARLDLVEVEVDVLNTNTAPLQSFLGVSNRVGAVEAEVDILNTNTATFAQGATADSAMQDLVDDTTPTLGGNLDGQRNTISNTIFKGDISGGTNANADELKSGTVDNARLDSDLQKYAVNDASSATNLPPSGVVGEAVVKTTVHTGDVAGVWNALTLVPGVIVDEDVDASADIAATKIAGEALTKVTVFAGDATGVWDNVTVTNFADALVGSKVQAWDTDLDTLALKDATGLTNNTKWDTASTDASAATDFIGTNADKLDGTTVWTGNKNAGGKQLTNAGSITSSNVLTGKSLSLTGGNTNLWLKGNGTEGTPAGAGDFKADGSVAMTGDLDLGGQAISNGAWEGTAIDGTTYVTNFGISDLSDGGDVLKKTGAIAMTGNLNFGGKSGTNLNDVTLTNEVSAKSLKLTGGNADFGTGEATNLTKVKTAAIEITGGATNGAMWICTNSATGGGKWSKLVAFRATLSHEYYLTNTVSRDIVWTGENYDYGDNFDLTVFTAPVDGLYIFEFSPYCVFVVKGYIAIRLFEGSTIRQESRVYIDAGFDSTPSVPLQIYLTNGATIKAVASGSTGTTNRIQGNYSAFFGRLIRELP